MEWAAQRLPGGQGLPTRQKVQLTLQLQVLLDERQAEQLSEGLPEQLLERVQEQEEVQVEVKVEVDVEVKVEIQEKTRVPMQVSTRLRTLLTVLPDEQREIHRETQARVRCAAPVTRCRFPGRLSARKLLCAICAVRRPCVPQ